MPLPRRLYDGDGTLVSLGEVLGRGGEATVFEMAGTQTEVAKLYHAASSREKQDKLCHMVSLADPELVRICAWPLRTLHSSMGGPLVGVVLPRITGYKELHQLYGPTSRKTLFPTADWSFLIHAARNVASAVAVVHEHDLVIGDINQGNLVVGQDARVKLWDCDSFQLTINQKVYYCEVGVGHFTPPELQGVSFRGVLRTKNHDAFGLAVLIFNLLFMGRHPFAGRYQGPEDMPIEKAIKEFRFAFSHQAASRNMFPPPNALRLVHASFGVASLFERAFAPAGCAPAGRPSAHEWLKSLEQLSRELKTCPRFRGHRFHNSSTTCPWCEIAQSSGADLFIALTAGEGLGAFDLQVTWARIAAVPEPAFADLSARGARGRSRTPKPPPTGHEDHRAIYQVMGGLGTVGTLLCLLTILPPGLIVIGLGLLIGAFAMWRLSPLGLERARRRAELRMAEGALDHLRRQVQEKIELAVERFRATRGALAARRDDYLRLKREYEVERSDLNARRQLAQLNDYLEQFYLHQFTVEGIGPGRRATLASWGIETAADVNEARILQIPGFGSTITGRLVEWRRSLEHNFRFDPSRAINPSQLQGLNAKYSGYTAPIERDLTGGRDQLEAIRREALAELDALLPMYEQARECAEQARVDASI